MISFDGFASDRVVTANVATLPQLTCRSDGPSEVGAVGGEVSL